MFNLNIEILPYIGHFQNSLQEKDACTFRKKIFTVQDFNQQELPFSGSVVASAELWSMKTGLEFGKSDSWLQMSSTYLEFRQLDEKVRRHLKFQFALIHWILICFVFGNQRGKVWLHYNWLTSSDNETVTSKVCWPTAVRTSVSYWTLVPE